MLKEIPPSRVLSAGLAIAMLLFLAAVYIASSPIRLGFSVAQGEQGVRVTRVAPDGPAFELLGTGDELLAVRSSAGSLQLEPWDAVAEPDDAALFVTYNRFFERHRQIWSILGGEQLELQVLSASGGSATWVRLQPLALRGINHLPWLFWYQVGCGLAILLMGVAAWAFVQSERGPRLYALAGLAIAIAIVASAIYTTRELSLPPEWFLTLSRINQFGAMLFAGTGTALFWYYPTQLGRFPLARVMLVIVGLTLAVNWLQLIPSLDAAARYPLLAWFAVDIAFAIQQWRCTRREPVERARLKWLIFAWFAGAFGYLGMVVTPQVLGLGAIAQQKYAWCFFVISYLGIALGIVRYRLFDLDRWILLVWFWFAFGVLFIVIDAMLVMTLHLETSMGLLVSLAVVGWAYLPIRQAFLTWLMPKDGRGVLHKRLPDILQQAFLHERSVDDQWSRALQAVFNPLTITPLLEPVDKPVPRENGLRLAVPGMHPGQGFLLSYAGGGARLFDRQDADFCGQALALFLYARDYHQSYQSGVISERKRVARDLHDDVGARLLSVVYRARTDEELQGLARDCLRELREVIQGLQKDVVLVRQSFARWQSEARERCRLFGLQLDMRLEEALADERLSPRQERNLSRILRECLTNTFKHAQADLIAVEFKVEHNRLVLRYQDNGAGMLSSSCEQTAGLGVLGIQERCRELGGEVCWWTPLDGGLAMRCEIPVKAS